MSYDSAPISIRASTFAKNASGEGGAGGMAGHYTGTGTGADGLPGTDGVGGAGGGIFSVGSMLQLENVTVTDNKAAGDGGGIAVAVMSSGSMTARHLTLVDNRADNLGGGLSFDAQYTQQPDTVSIVNSIIWGNSGLGTGTRGVASDVWALWDGVTIANSILADAPTAVGIVSCSNEDPKLKTLSWNGGPTPTRAPNDGSPAIDNATVLNTNEVPATDQRGFPRDDGTPDLGAFETRVQASNVVISAVSPTETTLGWDPGAWGYSVVFMRPDDPQDPKPVPSDGWIYNAAPAFGTGGFITRTAWTCVYAGSGNSVTVTGLDPTIRYTIMVCDTRTPDYLHNTEDALGNPVVTPEPATLVSPVHCPDDGVAGPAEDDPAHGHSLTNEPVFVWAPPAWAEGADFAVWLDGERIGDTALNPIGFRCFDGSAWTAFPATGGMPAGTVRLAFERAAGGKVAVRALMVTPRNWWVATTTADATASSASKERRFLYELPVWEDGTVVAGFTLIRAAQMTQLQEEANALRRLRALGDITFETIDAKITPIKAQHFQQLRSAIEDAAAATGEDTSVWTWTDPTLTPNQTVIKAVHLQELRDALEGIYPKPPARR
jgi:hypothetical protein